VPHVARAVATSASPASRKVPARLCTSYQTVVPGFDMRQMLPGDDPACHAAQYGAAGVVKGLKATFDMTCGAARVPDRGWALQRLWWAVYGANYCNDCKELDVTKAPARPGGRALARRRASAP